MPVKLLRPLLHYWNMYVSTYGTAKWATDILCKEVHNDQILVFMYYWGGTEVAQTMYLVCIPCGM